MTQRDDAVHDNEDYGTNLPETDEPIGKSDDDVVGRVPPDEPVTDTDVEAQEVYDQGVEVPPIEEDDAENTVISFRPKNHPTDDNGKVSGTG